MKFLKDFEQHFMANFPYSVNTRVSKKGKKHQNDSVQVIMFKVISPRIKLTVMIEKSEFEQT